MTAPLSIQINYWQNFSIDPADIELLYNLLLEKETPLSTEELTNHIIYSRIEHEIQSLNEKKTQKGNVYLPKDEFQIGDQLVFPVLKDQKGAVKNIREGNNPEFSTLKVIEVEMESGKTLHFASQIENHSLNNSLDISLENPNLNFENVKIEHGENITSALLDALENNAVLVKIAGKWFPRSLLIDVHIGHLNLAEAVLEEANGGPLPTCKLMEQVELSENADKNLMEFSFDLALQEDDRFDEVGPTGVTLWFLKDKEPENVKQIPIYLKSEQEEYDKESIQSYLEQFEGNVYDELEDWDSSPESVNKISISLTYPHWRSGTLPLSRALKKMFPSAYETPHVRFSFIDSSNNEGFPGWVVRPNRYIYGLDEWYRKNDLFPGSLVTVEKTTTPGKILVSFQKSRQNKEWLRTVLIGSDQGIVFAMLKHPITVSFNERMAVVVPDVETVDEIWKNKTYLKEKFEKTLLRIMHELSKLNPQGQVHAQELYAALNVVRRCPPGLVIFHLLHNNLISHLGDLYFRIIDKE